MKEVRAGWAAIVGLGLLQAPPPPSSPPGPDDDRPLAPGLGTPSGGHSGGSYAIDDSDGSVVMVAPGAWTRRVEAPPEE